MTKKPLPRSLVFSMVHDENLPLMRRRMAKLCSDDQARVFRDVSDQGQPLGHVGVLMRGREIFGWLLCIHSGRKWDRKPGDVFHTSMDFLLFSPAYRAHVEALGLGHLGRAGSHDHNALVTRATRYDAEDDEVTDTLWNEDLCNDLVRAVGMVEVIRAEGYQVDFKSEGVLVPRDEGEGWTLMGRKRAEDAALREIRPVTAWWDLPSDTRTLHYQAADIAPPPDHHDYRGTVAVIVQHLNTTPRVLLTPAQEGEFVLPRAHKMNFTAEVKSHLVEVEVRRSPKDLNWSISIQGAPGSGIYDFKLYPDLVDGKKALDTALAACRHGGRLPEAAQIADTADEMALGRQTWQQHVAATQEAHRRLRFVVDALTAGQAN